jgi:uncharacterized protein (TIGR03067 family)
MVEFELEGRKLPAGGSKIIVNGDSFTTIAMGAQYEGSVALDTTSTPKTFALHFNQGPEKGNVSLGIYELDGDACTICLGLTGRSRSSRRKRAAVTHWRR